MAGELDYLDDIIETTGVTLEKDEASAGNEGADTTAGTEAESGKGADTSTAQTQDKVEGTPGKDSLGSGGDDKQQQGKEEKGKGANPPGDPPGTITLQDGTKVRGGAERRWYEQGQLARAREIQVRAELNTANQKFQNVNAKYEELSKAVQQIGLDKPDDMSAAVALYKDLGKDPVGTVTKLLAQLKAAGYTVDGIGSAVDTQAITNILDRKLQPSAEQQGRQTQEQIDREVEQEITDLFQRFPDAKTHEAMLARVVEVEAANGNTIPLVEAYFRLRESAIHNDLDWSKPLGPQIEAKKQSGQQQQQQQQQQPQAPRVPGRPVGAASEEIDPAKVIQPASDSTGDIVKAAMREAGMNV